MPEQEFKCEFCEFTTTRNGSLTKHVTQKHNTNYKPKQLKCLICKNNFNPSRLQHHYIVCHNITNPLKLFILKYVYNIDEKQFARIVLERIYNHNCERKVTLIHAFNSFCNVVKYIRNVEMSDIDTFFDKVLVWRLATPGAKYNRTVCNMIFSDPEIAEKAYNDLFFSKNPYSNHGGKFSPFSKKFIKYEELDKNEKHVCISSFAKGVAKTCKERGNLPMTLEYWQKRGFDEQTAKLKLKQRQRTFSLERCIKKYGEEKGIEIFNKRQEKWQNTLNSKSEEEIINYLI